MSVTISGTTGVATPGVQNSASETITGNLTVGGNTAVAGTLQVGGVTTNIYPLVAGTPVTLTTQTFVDYTIPSTAKRITVMMNSVDTALTAQPLVQIGTGGTPDTTGYGGSAMQISTGNVTTGASFSAGFGFHRTAAYSYSGHLFITLLNPATNLWVASGAYGTPDATVGGITGGNKTLAGTLDTVRITIDTSSFSAGSVNVMWE